MVRFWLVLLLIACRGNEPARELDLERIEVTGAHMRTDTVGAGQFEETATFVLVDARNLATEGAFVSLGGDLLDDGGAVVGTLIVQSLWVPAGESRTFALVDSERKARPTATRARAKVTGAAILPPPPVRIEELHTFDDHGKLVLQAYVVNDAEREGTAMIVSSFHDDRGKPMTRPFSVIKVGAKEPGDVTPGECPDAGSKRAPTSSKCPIQFVGPQGSKRGQMFVGDVVY